MVQRRHPGRDVFSGVAKDRATRRADIMAEILRLEAGQARALREALLGYEGATDRLHEIEASIIDLRARLVAI